MRDHTVEQGRRSGVIIETVSGRYPRGSTMPLDQANLDIQVSALDEKRFRISIEDQNNPEMWLQITIQIRTALEELIG